MLFFSLLESSTNVVTTKKLHSLLLVGGLNVSQSCAHLGGRLINAYARSGAHNEALAVFERLPAKARSVFAYNSIFRCLVNEGQYKWTLELYQLMLEGGLVPDTFTFPVVLKACSMLQDLERGLEIKKFVYSNQKLARQNIFVQCALIDMLAKCGSLAEAQQVFDEMSQRDLVSWTAMICGVVQQGAWNEAMGLFRQMRLEGFRPDSVIVASVIPACGRLKALMQGSGLHGFSVRCGFGVDLCVANALIDMYAKCGHTHEACRVFHGMDYKDVISWSSLVAGHSLNEEFEKSVYVFVEMLQSGVRPSAVTIASVLPAFSDLQLLSQGREIHCYVLRHALEYDGFTASALVDMYAECGCLPEASMVFEATWDQDVGVWNSMVTAYAMKDDAKSTFEVMRRIHKAGFRPNSITLITVLPLCTRLSILKQGRELHGYAMRNGLSPLVSVQNSIIDMYSKCGCLDLALRVFEHMVERDRVTYNTIIAALGAHGHGHRASLLLTSMTADGIKPDKVTFIVLLSAFSHTGMLERGMNLFNSMVDQYGVVPDNEHYSCMVDLLGRLGHLDDAWEFINKMPVEPDIDVLGSLLAACRIYKRIDIAELVGKRIFGKNPTDPGYHILLANVYAAAGRWEDACRVRSMMRGRGLIKEPGNSCIQVGRSIHVFVAKDCLNQQHSKFQCYLDSLSLQLKDEGCGPNQIF